MKKALPIKILATVFLCLLLNGCLNIFHISQPQHVQTNTNFFIYVYTRTDISNPVAGRKFGAIKVPSNSSFVNGYDYDTYEPVIRDSEIEAQLEIDFPTNSKYEWWAGIMDESNVSSSPYIAIEMSVPNGGKYFLDYMGGTMHEGSITIFDKSIGHKLLVLETYSGEDTDGDGLADVVETDTGVYVDPSDTGTDPYNPDTDDDTIVDGWEVVLGDNPLQKRYRIEVESKISHRYSCDSYVDPYSTDFIDFEGESAVCVYDDTGKRCDKEIISAGQESGYFDAYHTKSAHIEMTCHENSGFDIYCELNDTWIKHTYEDIAPGWCYVDEDSYPVTGSLYKTFNFGAYNDVSFGLNDKSLCALELEPDLGSNRVICQALQITTDIPILTGGPVTVTSWNLSGNNEYFANSIYRDADKDGIPDNTDPDIDNDSIENLQDMHDYNPFLVGDIDIDFDGLVNSLDHDDDNDGFIDSEDELPYNNQEWLDTDSDLIGNNADWDDDNDGTPDTIDLEPLNNMNNTEIKLPFESTFKGNLHTRQ